MHPTTQHTTETRAMGEDKITSTNI